MYVRGERGGGGGVMPFLGEIDQVDLYSTNPVNYERGSLFDLCLFYCDGHQLKPLDFNCCSLVGPI